VEILGAAADQQVADRATDQVGLVAALAQAIEDAQRAGADVLAGDGVLVARDRPQDRCNGRDIVGHLEKSTCAGCPVAACACYTSKPHTALACRGSRSSNRCRPKGGECNTAPFV